MTLTFLDVLNRIVAVLGKFSELQDVGALRWDGRAYSASPPSGYDPFAAKWWAMLTAIGDMIRAQDSSLSAKQKEYLDRLLFGGMGSLNDFAISERNFGVEARQANEELDGLRRDLFVAFKRL